MRFPGPTHRNIYVRSERAGQRVMESVKQFIMKKLKLKVNEAKRAVAQPQERKFLGFSFFITAGKGPQRKIAPQALERFKERVREITRKATGVSMEQMIPALARYWRGWRGYLGFCETPWVLQDLDSWVRRRVRRAFWWQWNTSRNRLAELVRRGASRQLAAQAAGSRCGPWRASSTPALHQALSTVYLSALGLSSIYAGR